MSNSKVTSYILYALGEIALVVLGILIAVTLNNWNEQRKSSAFIENLITDFEEELIINILEANDFIKVGYRIDSMLRVYDTIRAENVLKLGWYFLYFDTHTQNYVDDNLLKIINLENELPPQYASLVPDLKELNKRIKSRRTWEEKEIEISLSRRKEMLDNLPWYFPRDTLEIQQSAKFFSSNQFHKNKIRQFLEFRLNENIWDASLLRTTSVALLWEIKKSRSSGKNLKMEPFLQDLGLRPMTTIMCYDPNVDMIKNEVSFRRNFIFYNESEDTVAFTIRRKSNHEPIGYVKKPPGHLAKDEFSMNRYRYYARMENDSCQTIYYHSKGDYIIFN